MEALSLALLLATFNKALLDLLAEPVQRRYPGVDLWWMVYVALVTGGLMAWFAGVNVFAELIGDELTGRLLSLLAVGAGTNLINQVFTALPAGQGGGLRSLDAGRAPRYRGW